MLHQTAKWSMSQKRLRPPDLFQLPYFTEEEHGAQKEGLPYFIFLFIITFIILLLYFIVLLYITYNI